MILKEKILRAADACGDEKFIGKIYRPKMAGKNHFRNDNGSGSLRWIER